MAVLVWCAAGLTGCGESLTSAGAVTNVSSAELVAKQQTTPGGLQPLAGADAQAAAKLVKAAPRMETLGKAPDSAAIVPDPKSAADAFIAVTTPGNTAYKVGPEDVLDVSVFKVPELSRTAQVADGGTINLPLVGEIQAAGKTARDIELDLTKKLGDKYLKSPQVTVFVKEYNSQRVTIEGAVKKPGVYPIRGKSSLLQMVANAGGLEDLAEQGNVIVVRQVNGKRYAARFDMDAIRKGGTPDPALQQGDVIIANTSEAKAAFQNFLKILPAANVFALL